MKIYIQEESIANIPDWCPLPDADKEEGGGVDVS